MTLTQKQGSTRSPAVSAIECIPIGETVSDFRVRLGEFKSAVTYWLEKKAVFQHEKKKRNTQ